MAKKAKKKKSANKQVVKKQTSMAEAAVDKETQARELVRKAIGLKKMVPDKTPLAALLIDDAGSKAALAESLRDLGVNINDGPVIKCNTVGQVVAAVKARI